MSVQTQTLTDFLLARIAQDREAAYHAQGLLGVVTPWYQAANLRERGLTRADAQFVEHVTPTRVLAECEAKRQIVETYVDMDELGGTERIEQRLTLRWTCALLALPYADHPDYREEWRP